MNKDTSYTCSRCGRVYQVKPKRCVCEKDDYQWNPDCNYYLLGISDSLPEDLYNEMLSITDIFSGSLFQLDGEKLSPELSFKDEIPSSAYVLVKEEYNPGIETTDTYSRTYATLSEAQYERLKNG